MDSSFNESSKDRKKRKNTRNSSIDYSTMNVTMKNKAKPNLKQLNPNKIKNFWKRRQRRQQNSDPVKANHKIVMLTREHTDECKMEVNRLMRGMNDGSIALLRHLLKLY